MIFKCKMYLRRLIHQLQQSQRLHFALGTRTSRILKIVSETSRAKNDNFRQLNDGNLVKKILPLKFDSFFFLKISLTI